MHEEISHANYNPLLEILEDPVCSSSPSRVVKLKFLKNFSRWRMVLS